MCHREGFPGGGCRQFLSIHDLIQKVVFPGRPAPVGALRTMLQETAGGVHAIVRII